jgi:hypothetical protein
VTFFRALSSKLPFDGKSQWKVLAAVEDFDTPVPQLQTHSEGGAEATVSEAMREFVRRALTRSLGPSEHDRFPSAAEMKTHLDIHFRHVFAGTVIIVHCNETPCEAEIVGDIVSSAPLPNARFYFHARTVTDKSDPKTDLQKLLAARHRVRQKRSHLSESLEV